MIKLKNLVSAIALGTMLATAPASTSFAETVGLKLYFGGPGWVLGPGGIYIGPGGIHVSPWYEPGWYYYGDYYYYKPDGWRRYCLTNRHHARIVVRRHGRVYYLRRC